MTTQERDYIDNAIELHCLPLVERIDELELKLEACRKVIERWASSKEKKYIEQEYKTLWGITKTPTKTKKSSRPIL